MISQSKINGCYLGCLDNRNSRIHILEYDSPTGHYPTVCNSFEFVPVDFYVNPEEFNLKQNKIGFCKSCLKKLDDKTIKKIEKRLTYESI